MKANQAPGGIVLVQICQSKIVKSTCLKFLIKYILLTLMHYCTTLVLLPVHICQFLVLSTFYIARLGIRQFWIYLLYKTNWLNYTVEYLQITNTCTVSDCIALFFSVKKSPNGLGNAARQVIVELRAAKLMHRIFWVA